MTLQGMTIATYNEMHDADVIWLAAEKALAEADGKRLLVVTHHAPYTQGTSHPSHTGPLNCAFATDLSHMFGRPIVAWVHGHTHFSSSQTVGGTLLVSNQRGYADNPNEGTDFVPEARIKFDQPFLNTLFPWKEA